MLVFEELRRGTGPAAFPMLQHGRAGVNVTQKQEQRRLFLFPALAGLFLASPSICMAINPELWRIFPAKAYMCRIPECKLHML